MFESTFVDKSTRFPAYDADINSAHFQKAKGIETISLATQAWSDVPNIIKSRRKQSRRRSAYKKIILDYSHNSTIHGLSYIFAEHRPIYERLCWLLLTLISFCFAGLFIWYTYLKWQDSPVIVGFDQTLVPIYKIPFPTVTICPEIKMELEFFNFTNISERYWHEVQHHRKFRNLQNFTTEELEYFTAILHICEEDVVKPFSSFAPTFVHSNVAQTLFDLLISTNMTSVWKWNGRFFLSDTIVNYVPTDEGICYQFNSLQPKDIYRNISYLSYYSPKVIDFQNVFDDLPPMNNFTGNWSLEDGYVDQGFNSYPQRTFFSLPRNALFLILEGFKHNFEYACRSFKQGYKVYLNSPESVALTTGTYIDLSHNHEVIVRISPQYVIGDKNLREFSPEKRQCYFNDERQLRYFLHYSQSNCQTECLTNFTIAKCGCAKFWMPKPLDVPTCEVADIACYKNAQKELNLLIQNETIQQTKDEHFKITCGCMPSCTSLDYNVEISSAWFDLDKMQQSSRMDFEDADHLFALIVIHFKENYFAAIKRTVRLPVVLLSTTTLIANCGGIFGLFMGCSILSLIELIYFFSVRLFNNIRRRRQTKRRIMTRDM